MLPRIKTTSPPFLRAAALAVLCAGSVAGAPAALVLKPEAFGHYVDQFNRDDEELYVRHIPNAQAWSFLKTNVPLFECPDQAIERTYYFRWWTYRKHIKSTPDGFVITEFLPPVGWAGKHNTINCAAGHHFYEGRWLHDPRSLNDYTDYFKLLTIYTKSHSLQREDGRILTILWDKTGDKYGRGEGLRVFADGRPIAHSDSLGRVTGTLPSRTGTEGASAGWRKHEGNPVLGGSLGTCFDVTLLQENDLYRMWFSWRPKDSIALVESRDGIHWSEPQIVLGPNRASDWEGRINRPTVVKRDDVYHMWYTGQSPKRSWIGYATSPDGRTWTRMSAKPVLSPERHWEGVAVMCPHVLWEEKTRLYRMWYSAGEQYEPNAIGYATSSDGINWTRYENNPIFAADRRNPWEQHKVTACQVIPAGDWHIMFYIGFRDEDRAQIGLARSRDGVTGWQRHPANPILFPATGAWDADACYKPFGIFDAANDRWLLWYNGRKGSVEQIGLATHSGYDLGFP